MTETTHDALVRQTAAVEELLDYFQGQRPRWEADVALAKAEYDALAANLPAAMSKTVYVDAALGDDNNAGTSAATAYATIEKAILMQPKAGHIQIILMGDVTVLSRSYAAGPFISIYALPGLAVKPKFTLAQYARAGAYTHECTFLLGNNGMSCDLYMSGIHVELPAEDDDPAKNIISYGFLGSGVGCGQLTFGLHACDITVPAAPQVGMVVPGARCVNLSVSQTVVPAGMAGNWIAGIAASTDPVTSRNVNSNLAAL